MTSDLFNLPDLPMPLGRAEARRLALRRELAAGGVPRRRLARWKVAVPVLAAGAIAAAFAIGSPTTHTASLTASWTAVPTALSGDRAVAAQQQCQSRLIAQHWPISVSAMAGVLSEQRGELTAVLMSGAGQYGVCIGRSGSALFTGVGEVSTFSPAEGIVLDGSPGVLNGADPFRVAYGQVAPSVASVLIDTADGRHVDATVSGGRFFAWWPSGADAKSITAYASDGGVVRTLNPAPSVLTPSPVHRSGAS